MKTEHLKEFVALARRGSFREAARDLFISQPTLSNHIKSLETEVGAELIDRSRDNALTEAGFVLLEAAQTAMMALDSAQDRIDALRQRPDGTPARVGVYARTLEVKSALRDRCACPFTYVPYTQQRPLLYSFSQGDVDVMCTYDVTSIPSLRKDVEAAGLAWGPLGEETCSMAMKRTHPLASVPLARHAFRGAEFVILNAMEFEYWKSIITGMLGADLGFRFRLVPVDNLLNLEIADLGDGILVCLSSMIDLYFANREEYVVCTEVDGESLVMGSSFVYRPDNANPNVEEVLRVLRELGNKGR